MAINNEHLPKIARRMRYDILARLTTGDVVAAGHAAEQIAKAAFFPDLQALLRFLETCGEEWIAVMMGLNGEPYNALMTKASGRSCASWLALERALRNP